MHGEVARSSPERGRLAYAAAIQPPQTRRQSGCGRCKNMPWGLGVVVVLGRTDAGIHLTHPPHIIDTSCYPWLVLERTGVQVALCKMQGQIKSYKRNVKVVRPPECSPSLSLPKLRVSISYSTSWLVDVIMSHSFIHDTLAFL